MVSVEGERERERENIGILLASVLHAIFDGASVTSFVERFPQIWLVYHITFKRSQYSSNYLILQKIDAPSFEIARIMELKFN